MPERVPEEEPCLFEVFNTENFLTWDSLLDDMVLTKLAYATDTSLQIALGPSPNYPGEMSWVRIYISLNPKYADVQRKFTLASTLPFETNFLIKIDDNILIDAPSPTAAQITQTIIPKETNYSETLAFERPYKGKYISMLFVNRSAVEYIRVGFRCHGILIEPRQYIDFLLPIIQLKFDYMRARFHWFITGKYSRPQARPFPAVQAPQIMAPFIEPVTNMILAPKYRCNTCRAVMVPMLLAGGPNVNRDIRDELSTTGSGRSWWDDPHINCDLLLASTVDEIIAAKDAGRIAEV